MITTVSLETAKLLKEAGFRQDNGFEWVKFKIDGDYRLIFQCVTNHAVDIISAPTTDELLDLFPDCVTIQKKPEGYEAWIGILEVEKDPVLCEALARLWMAYEKRQK